MPIRNVMAFLLAAMPALADAPLGERVGDGILKLFENGGRADSYLFTIDRDEKKYGSDGTVKTSSARRIRLEDFEGERAGFVTHRDGKPVPEDERKTQEERIRKAREERKTLSAMEKAKRQKQGEKRRAEQTGFLREFPDAFDFKLAGKAVLNGRSTLVVDFAPRAGYRPSQLRARMFLKARGRAWLDEQESQLAKLDGEIFDDMSLGGVLASVGKGSKFEARQIRLEPGVWAMEYEHSKFAARVLVFKSFNEEETTLYSGFTKFNRQK